MTEEGGEGEILVDWADPEAASHKKKHKPPRRGRSYHSDSEHSKPHRYHSDRYHSDTNFSDDGSLMEDDEDDQLDNADFPSSQQGGLTKLFRALTRGSNLDADEDETSDHLLLNSVHGVVDEEEDEDDDGSVQLEDEECIILTDDEEEDDDEVSGDKSHLHTEKDVASPVFQQQQEEDPMLDFHQSSTSLGLPRYSKTEKAALAAVFAEKHPWRNNSLKVDDSLNSSVERPVRPLPPAISSPPQDSIRSVGSSESLELSPHDAGRPGRRSSSKSFQDASDEESGGSSSDDSVDSSMQSSESAAICQEPELETDYPALDYVPNSFLPSTQQPQGLPLSLLDPSLRANLISKGDANRFAYQHALLLRAILQLLAERDWVGVEADIDDPSCIRKKGPLKKLSQSTMKRNVWKVKYVEIRPGSFTYYEDTTHKTTGGDRKTIPLRSHKCSVDVVKRNVFALTIQDGPRRLWKTNSEDELKTWIRAIQGAMIGSGGARDEESSVALDMTLYQDSVTRYQQAAAKLAMAKNRAQYMSCMEDLLKSKTCVPMRWVRNQVDDGSRARPRRHHHHASIQKRMNASVAEFWKSLSRETVSINDHTIKAQSPRGAERIIGALTRCILEYDKTAPTGTIGEMSELQAISYARDVMSTILRIRAKDHAHFALDYLCQNPSLVIVLPDAASPPQPLNLHVSYAKSESNDKGNDRFNNLLSSDASGWVTTRSAAHKNWKKRYCVVSEGVLSYFEYSEPRPHGLKGQAILAGTTVTETPQDDQNHVLRIETKDGEMERELAFQDKAVLSEWKGAIQKSIDSCSSSGYETPRSRKKPPIIQSSGRIMRTASEGGVKIIKGATDILRVIRPIGGSSKGDKQPVGESDTSRPSSLASSSFTSENRPKVEPTVEILAEGSADYKIITSDPSGIGAQDTWLTVRAKFMQTFALSGGSLGRISKSDELIYMEFCSGGQSPQASRSRLDTY